MRHDTQVSPRLDYLTVKGFKSIGVLEKLALRRLNVLIGSNGAGKSNFIGVFELLHNLVEGTLQEYVAKAGGADRILFFGAKQTPRIELELSFDDERNGYHVELLATDDDRLAPTAERGWFWDKKRYPNKPYDTYILGRGSEAGISRPDSGISTYIEKDLRSWRVYHFHDTSDASPMRRTSDVQDNRFLRADAANLAAYLYFLQQTETESFELINKTIRRVAPFFQTFRLAPLRLQPSKIQLEWRHSGYDRYFDVSALSDGTLRFIALTTLLLQPEKYLPAVILLDEPELGLHPYALTMLSSLLKSASKRVQVAVSTQSPVLLDHFDPEDTIVVDQEADGGSSFRRLSTAELEEWLKEFSLGQLWEKNYFGGRPTNV